MNRFANNIITRHTRQENIIVPRLQGKFETPGPGLSVPVYNSLQQTGMPGNEEMPASSMSMPQPVFEQNGNGHTIAGKGLIPAQPQYKNDNGIQYEPLKLAQHKPGFGAGHDETTPATAEKEMDAADFTPPQTQDKPVPGRLMDDGAFDDNEQLFNRQKANEPVEPFFIERPVIINRELKAFAPVMIKPSLAKGGTQPKITPVQQVSYISPPGNYQSKGALLREQMMDQNNTAPVIKVNIGRIEVKMAAPPAAKPVNNRATEQKNKMSLEDYLKKRNSKQ